MQFHCGLWNKIGETWNTNYMELNQMIMDAKNRSNNAFFKISMITGCWSWCNHRNKIFDNETNTSRKRPTCGAPIFLTRGAPG